MQIRRDNLGSAVINDKLYVFGGKTRNTDGTTINQALNSMEIFDPLTGQWSFGTSMFTGRRNMSVGTLNNRIQVIGGEATSNALPSSQNDEYNPITQTWRSLPSRPTPVHGAAFGTIDNVIYMAAGGPFAGLSTTDSVQAFTL
jgi:N-acetylneuraminic acid mutarotase